MKTVCIISFGNSTKYRLTIDKGADQVSDIKAEVKNYLENKFPTLSPLNFYDKVSVVPVDPSNCEKYKDYPEFDDNSIDEIKKVLSREVEDYEDVRNLNSNAPWGSDNCKI